MRLNPNFSQGSKQTSPGRHWDTGIETMEEVQYGYRATYTHGYLILGNTKLLETIVTCPQVFQRRGRSHGKVAQQLHASISRGMLPKA